MNQVLNLNDKIKNEKYNNKTVAEIIENDRKELIRLSKDGYYFHDDVCKKAGYTRTIRDEKVVTEFIDKSKIAKDKKVYTKDTESVKKIIERLSTLDYNPYSYNEEGNDELVEEEF